MEAFDSLLRSLNGFEGDADCDSLRCSVRLTRRIGLSSSLLRGDDADECVGDASDNDEIRDVLGDDRGDDVGENVRVPTGDSG